MKTESSLTKCPECTLHYDPARNSRQCPHIRTEANAYFIKWQERYITRAALLPVTPEGADAPPVTINREFLTRRIER